MSRRQGEAMNSSGHAHTHRMRRMKDAKNWKIAGVAPDTKAPGHTTNVDTGKLLPLECHRRDKPAWSGKNRQRMTPMPSHMSTAAHWHHHCNTLHHLHSKTCNCSTSQQGTCHRRTLIKSTTYFDDPYASVRPSSTCCGLHTEWREVRDTHGSAVTAHKVHTTPTRHTCTYLKVINVEHHRSVGRTSRASP